MHYFMIPFLQWENRGTARQNQSPRAHLFGKVAQLMSAMNKKNRDIGLSQSDSWFLFVQSRFSEGSPIAEHLFLIQNTEIAEYCWTSSCLYWSFSLVDWLILFFHQHHFAPENHHRLQLWFLNLSIIWRERIFERD